jgi:RNA polymerase sigma-70 factor (ECF subfamily)
MRRPIPNRRTGGELIPFLRAPERATSTGLEEAYRERRRELVAFLERRLGSSSEAEDIAQDAFAHLWARRNDLRDENLPSLIFVTARNMATDALRRRRRSPATPSLDTIGVGGREVADEVPSAERTLIARTDVAIVQRLIAELPPKCRKAFIGYKFHLQSYEEIAENICVTTSMARKYVRRALLHCISRYSELDAWE